MIYQIVDPSPKGKFDGQVATRDSVVMLKGTTREFVWAVGAKFSAIRDFAQRRELRILVRERTGSAFSWDIEVPAKEPVASTLQDPPPPSDEEGLSTEAKQKEHQA